MILLIDNYDSFTYNLVQRLGEIDAALDVRVFRNDQITPDEVAGAAADAPDHFPRAVHAARGRRLQRGAAPLRASIPILGVCLGHQCIGHVFGGEVVRNDRIMHGKTSPIHHDGQGVFRGLSNPFEATRYHSLVIRRDTFHNPDFVDQRLDRGRRDHGRPASHLATSRRPVSSGELSHRRGTATAAEFPWLQRMK